MNDSVIMDAFTMDGSMLWQANDVRPFAITRLETLRRVSGFVPRAYVAPEASQTPLPQANTVFSQLRMPLGTIVWGYLIADTGLLDESWQAFETKSPRRMFSEPELAAPSGTASFGVNLLLQPFVVASTSDLNIEIYKGNGTASSETTPMQLVLLCAEPTDREECKS
jgi:hypothetical protein